MEPNSERYAGGVNPGLCFPGIETRQEEQKRRGISSSALRPLAEEANSNMTNIRQTTNDKAGPALSVSELDCAA